MAVGEFNGDGFTDLAVIVEGVVTILANDGIWNGPAPRPHGTPRLTFARLQGGLPPQQQPEAWWTATPRAVALPKHAVPQQPLRDLEVPASNRLEALAMLHAVATSFGAWDAFVTGGLFRYDRWDVGQTGQSF
jgi:hypothetical protein